MTSDGAHSLDSLPLPERRRINQICVEFEQAWSDGQHPRVETFAARMTGRAGRILLVELIAQDVDLRIANGQIVGRQQFYDRFPAAGQEINAAFALIESRVDSSLFDDQTVAPTGAGSGPPAQQGSVTVDTGSLQHRRFAEIVAGLMENIQNGQHYEVEQVEREYPQHTEELRLLHPTMQLLADLSSEPGRESGASVTGTLGDFQLGREIGRGGMGIVYEARQISLDKQSR